jgi:hypothetical protein
MSGSYGNGPTTVLDHFRMEFRCLAHHGAALLRMTWFAREKLCHFRQSERVGNLAFDATEFTAARFYEHKVHGLVALRAGRWRRIFGHWTLTLDQARAQHSQSPGTAEDGAGDDLLCAVRAN